MRHCIDCGRKINGDCEFCIEQRELLEEKLELCRTCPKYKTRHGMDGCSKLGKKCCLLAAKLKHGWRCPLGLHD